MFDSIFCWMSALFASVPIVPGPEINPGEAAGGLFGAIQGSEWTLAIGCGVMLATWILQTFVFPNVNAKVLPWIAVLIALLGVGSVALVADPVNIWAAVWAGVQAGISAAGTYGLLPKPVKQGMKNAVANRQ